MKLGEKKIMNHVKHNNKIRIEASVPRSGLCNYSDKLREKRPNTELCLAGIFLYSVRIQENTDQK